MKEFILAYLSIGLILQIIIAIRHYRISAMLNAFEDERGRKANIFDLIAIISGTIFLWPIIVWNTVKTMEKRP